MRHHRTLGSACQSREHWLASTPGATQRGEGGWHAALAHPQCHLRRCCVSGAAGADLKAVAAADPAAAAAAAAVTHGAEGPWMEPSMRVVSLACLS